VAETPAGVVVRLNDRATPEALAVVLAVTVNVLVATTLPVVPEMMPVDDASVRPEGKAPEVTEYETVPALTLATT
jgi:hypothetical protein